MTEKASIESWAKVNGVSGIRFFPSNTSKSSPTEILNGALFAIEAMEAGRVTEYKDDFHPEI